MESPPARAMDCHSASAVPGARQGQWALAKRMGTGHARPMATAPRTTAATNTASPAAALAASLLAESRGAKELPQRLSLLRAHIADKTCQGRLPVRCRPENLVHEFGGVFGSGCHGTVDMWADAPIASDKSLVFEPGQNGKNRGRGERLVISRRGCRIGKTVPEFVCRQ